MINTDKTQRELISMDKTLSITVISKACGVSAPTLRVWEKRYNAFTPDRDDAGQRLYSEEDLARAKIMAALIERGYAISNIVNLSIVELRARLDNGKEDSQAMQSKVQIKKLLSSLEKFDIDSMAEEMQFRRMSIGAKDFIFNIALPIMRETGVLVSKGKISVTQEHIVSSIVRDQLSKITIPNSGNNVEKFALATPEGNLHELSIIIADILCKLNRIPTSYLGAAHPADCLGQAVSALKCQTIVMGVISSEHWNYEERMTPYLKALDNSLKTKVNVILGGGWQLDFPKFKNIKNITILNNFEDFDELLSKIL